jgi:hypothetical protein
LVKVFFLLKYRDHSDIESSQQGDREPSHSRTKADGNDSRADLISSFKLASHTQRLSLLTANTRPRNASSANSLFSPNRSASRLRALTKLEQRKLKDLLTFSRSKEKEPRFFWFTIRVSK